MTPDKRLDQVEPVLADVAQKTDRLIESNGQILTVSLRADNNAAITAKGIADLTLEMRQQFKRQQNQIDQLFNSQTELNQKTDQLAGDQAKLRQEMQKGFQEVNQNFAQVTQVQQQILALLLDR